MSMSRQSGYYRFPTISGDRVVFVCEDDLWSVSVTGGIAIRLTANLGEVSRPALSPDGVHLAFMGREEGHSEVYCMPAEGGVAKRLTFLGAAAVAGWSRDSQSIIFTSHAGQPFRRISNLYTIGPEGGLPERLPFGLAHSVSFGANGGTVLGRNTADPARWKRYRGGTAGVLWIDRDGSGSFEKLLNLNGNLACPLWISGSANSEQQGQIYFISDHEGIGNLYACTPAGENLQRLTHNTEYYVRNASTDGRKIVYQAGADLFCFDPDTHSNHRIEIQFHSPRVQSQRKFVDADDFLEEYDLHPEGHSTVITSRGRSFTFGNWEGAVTQLGQPETGRYRLTHWLNDKTRLVTVTDRTGVEAIEILTPELGSTPEQLQGLDIGRVVSLEVSPVADQVVLSNHRHELLLVDLSTHDCRVLDHSEYARIQGFCWSPDGQWVAYGCAETQQTVSIKVCHVANGTTHRLTSPRFRDVRPAFDPEGKFIYFLSVREFNPVYDSIYFDLSFPKGMRPFLISLQRDTPSPFVAVPRPLNPTTATNGKSKPKAEAEEETQVSEEETAADGESSSTSSDDIPAIEIDFEGIEQRIVGFPVSEGLYQRIWGVEGKVLFSSAPVQGSLDWFEQEPEATVTLEVYDFEAQKQERIASNITSFRVARDNKTLIYRSRGRLRVCNVTSQDQDKSKDEKPGRKSGWLNLRRVRVSVSPVQEWQQMFREIWRLQKEQFWTADMSGVDWERVYQRYRPLLDRVSTRSEFSDLIWEMQGELGTSHAYEGGGDYREEPDYRLGFLGADFKYDPASDAYRVEHILRGDSWNKHDSPLNQIGINVQAGDLLLAVGGQRVSKLCSPPELLVHQAGCEVALTFANAADPETTRTVTVKTLYDETPVRYREWVERNHQTVDVATQGRVGYVHIPNMGAGGYAEFHRYYFAEVNKDALIVDVRYNGGGHVSQLILEKLARQRLGYDVPRWGKPEPYPSDAVLGSMVALTDEHAGSDGDIFSHCFKLMKLGPLVGKRTWGGVIGISPRHGLVDRSIVTQPEYSFWFKDVGWGVENYGTDPDIEVEITPQDWAQGKDPQLEKAIQVILEQLEQNPVRLPDFGDRPHLPLPE
jgi:tricorn protease